MILFGRNKDHKRTSLSLKWHLNRGDFQDQVRGRFQPNTHESAREVDTYQLTTEHICSQLETATSYSLADDSLTNSLDITANSIECDVSDNKLLGLLASNCKEPELYHLRTTMASSPPQVGKSDAQFWTYVDSGHLLWLEAIKIFGFDCPSIHDDFMLVDELQYTECKKFSEFLVEHLNDLTLVRKRSCLLDAWILANNI